MVDCLKETTEFQFQVNLRRTKKAVEHNNTHIGFAEYCPHGLKSASSFVHREALRVCAELEAGHVKEALNHLIDVGVFADLMWDYASQIGLEEQKGYK